MKSVSFCYQKQCFVLGPRQKENNIYSRTSSLRTLTAVFKEKDPYTFKHCQKVAYYTEKLAVAAGLDMEEVERARDAALLHDIGKIMIDKKILNKNGPLTDREYQIIKKHVEESVRIIQSEPLLADIIPAVAGHHERYDGKGYPKKLKGKNIPIAARILCVADAFDAMTSRRAYKSAYSMEYAMKELTDQAGLQCDPHLSRLFIYLIERGEVEVQKDIETN